jgi:hypothetical protein
MRLNLMFLFLLCFVFLCFFNVVGSSGYQQLAKSSQPSSSIIKL